MSMMDIKPQPHSVITAPVKPGKDIALLVEHLAAMSNKSLTQKRKPVSFIKSQENQCVLLLRGSVALYRNNDGVIVTSESAPFIFGLGNQLPLSRYFSLRTQEDSLLGTLAFDEARRIIKKHHLWEQFASLLIYKTNKLYSHCISISQLSSYEIIKSQLLQLNEEPPAIRQNVTAANYILARTFLSRSGVMRILSRLKADGYITAERGVLLKINSLPDNY